jgi:hypothetical protein
MFFSLLLPQKLRGKSGQIDLNIHNFFYWKKFLHFLFKKKCKKSFRKNLKIIRML